MEAMKTFYVNELNPELTERGLAVQRKKKTFKKINLCNSVRK